MPTLRPFPVPDGAAAADLLRALEAALGDGPALLPYAAGTPAPDLPERLGALPDRLAVAVGTSGSTGVVKRALLTVDNLVASATATHQRLGGAGRWLLAMPAHHVAGLQVLVRSVVAGTEPAILDLAAGFTPAGFAATTRTIVGAGPGPLYTALVPAQVTRLLEAEEGLSAMREYAAILVGGAPASSRMLTAAKSAGVRLVLTYGMSETAGGCVYDGSPLAVSQVHIDNDHHVVLGGATVAHGYLGGSRPGEDAFTVDADGGRWFRTDDLGLLDDAGLLRITGRADDLINTGGLKVAPGSVEDAITRYVTGVREAVVVGSAHPRWGQAVSAAVTLRPGTAGLTVGDVRAALRGIVPDHALPQRLLVLDEIPVRGPGKPDRRALVAAFGETLETTEGRRT